MSVVVQCFHCNAVLELDEGFRGGVCRCSTCGSLLQVPKAPPGTAPERRVRPAVPPGARAAAEKPKAAPENGKSPGATPLVPVPRRGLDAGDMGGSSSGLGRIQKTRPIAGSPTRRISAASSSSSIRTAMGRAGDSGISTGSAAAGPTIEAAGIPSAALTQAPAAAPPAHPPAHGLPEIRAARGNRILFWIGVLLIVAIAGVTLVLAYLYVVNPEPPMSPHPSLGAVSVERGATGPERHSQGAASRVDTPLGRWL